MIFKMKKRFTGFLYTTAVLQVLTACIHSLSFVAEQKPSDETEAQLLQLMSTYEMDAGAGFNPTMHDLFTAMSACFALLCLLAGLINLYLVRKCKDPGVIKVLLGISSFISVVCFIIMLVFTFLPPIILTGLIAVCSLLAYISIETNKNMTA